ncbi:Amino-acid acetyltransferase [Porphyridium purpureum]|uniref:amino-acid N-acetyltransferase n=1 Tax=Porphyridium purpureum TaxID=35688 RepID=A0A5J4YZJ5_PORPP|nr:Amino-acid acetyltransferase [Porphyridium purpureum]|eukprot:POR9721..scf208_2
MHPGNAGNVENQASKSIEPIPSDQDAVFSTANGNEREGYEPDHLRSSLMTLGLSNVDDLTWSRTGSLNVSDHATPNAPESTLYYDNNHFMNMRLDKVARQDFVRAFRMSSPYIISFRGSVFVIHIPGVLVDEPVFESTLADIALLSFVGIRIVLVIGTKMQVERELRRRKIPARFVNDVRITTRAVMEVVKSAAGDLLFEVESKLNRANYTSKFSSRVSVVTGSFYSAQPVGVIDGVDCGYTGSVRDVEVELVNERLRNGDLLLLSNVGVSPSGEIFNCLSEQVASEVAIQLQAEKVIYLKGQEILYDPLTGSQQANISLRQAEAFVQQNGDSIPKHFRLLLDESIRALRGGTRRAHLLNRFSDGVIPMEIFHRDGVGLMITRNVYEGLRIAGPQDVTQLFELLAPLASQGILPSFSLDGIEKEIDSFVVLQREGTIIACIQFLFSSQEFEICDDAFCSVSRIGEIRCVGVHPDYRNQGKALILLSWIERQAIARGVKLLMVSSSLASAWWFVDRGYREAEVSSLSNHKKVLKNTCRIAPIKPSESHGGSFVDRSEAALVIFRSTSKGLGSEREPAGEPNRDVMASEDDKSWVGDSLGHQHPDASQDDGGDEIDGFQTPRMYVKLLESERLVDEEDLLGRL